MSLFAQMLDAALAEPLESPKTASAFEAALRSLEGTLAGLPIGVEASPRGARAADPLAGVPRTVDGIKRAFRRRAFETHPDRPGGSHEAFLRAQADLEADLAALRSSAAHALGRRYGQPERNASSSPRVPVTYA